MGLTEQAEGSVCPLLRSSGFVNTCSSLRQGETRLDESEPHLLKTDPQVALSLHALVNPVNTKR